MPRPTLHLVPEAAWDGRDPAAPYTPAAYAADGFVHCTDGDDEMVATANRFYRADPQPFLVLTIDLERTGSPWRFDEPRQAVPARLRPDRPRRGHRRSAGSSGTRTARSPASSSGSATEAKGRLSGPRRSRGVDAGTCARVPVAR